MSRLSRMTAPPVIASTITHKSRCNMRHCSTGAARYDGSDQISNRQGGIRMRTIRSLIASAAVAALGLFLAGPAAAQKLVISNWDAYMPPDFLENFTKETGI